MTGDIRRIEPLQREHTRPWATGRAGTHRFHAPLHVGDAVLGLGHCPSRAPDIANRREDRVEIMGIECDDGGRKRRGRNLALGHRTDIADTLRQHEIGLELADAGDIDLIDAAVIAHGGMDRGVDLPARQTLETHTRAREPGQIGDARRIVAAVRDPDEPVGEP